MLVPRTVLSSSGFPSNRTVVTAWGCSIRWISRKEDLSRMISRETLNPPPVEPAQAPQNMSITSTVREKVGHWSKSAVPKPVVVMMEAT